MRETAVYHTDVQTFLQAVSTNGQMEIEQLNLAINAYEGEFLAGFYVTKAAVFEEWTASQREYLHQQALTALHQLTNHAITQQNPDEGIPLAQRLLQMDPWRESAHRQLLHLLAMNGQTSAALKQYQNCQNILATELGIEPSPETETLANTIKNGRYQNWQTPQTSTQPAHNLPSDLTSFVGREAEINLLQTYLDDDVTRLISIVGMGGIGKTRLALACGRREVENGRFPDGIFFVPLQPLTQSNQIGQATADALSIQLQGHASPDKQIATYLHNKKALLIFDNFEHLIDAKPFILVTVKANN